MQGQRLQVKIEKVKKIVGVVSNIPKHFRTGNEAVPEIKDLMLDIGAKVIKKFDAWNRNRGHNCSFYTIHSII